MIGLRELFERGPVSLGTLSVHRNKRYLNRGFVGLKVTYHGGSINIKNKVPAGDTLFGVPAGMSLRTPIIWIR